jgi:hypothetical protein
MAVKEALVKKKSGYMVWENPVYLFPFAGDITV